VTKIKRRIKEKKGVRGPSPKSGSTRDKIKKSGFWTVAQQAQRGNASRRKRERRVGKLRIFADGVMRDQERITVGGELTSYLLSISEEARKLETEVDGLWWKKR